MIIRDYRLSPDEIMNLTGRQRYKAQIKALESIGMRPLIDEKGQPAVTALAVAIAMNPGVVLLKADSPFSGKPVKIKLPSSLARPMARGSLRRGPPK